MKTLTLFILFASMSTSLLALNPSRTYSQRPEKFNMAYTEHKVRTSDGEAELNAWYFPALKKTTQLVLIAHNGEGNMGDYLRRVDAFLAMGFNVVTFDYRGFGESSEFEIDNNMYIYPHFQDDVSSMIDYCRTQFTPSFELYGWGMGAGLSLGIGYTRPEIKSIIADTPFLSMEDLEERFSSWDEPMEVPFAGYDRRYEPLFAKDNAPMPDFKGVLLILGSSDLLFKEADLETLRSGYKKNTTCELFLVENPDRLDNFTAGKTEYTGQVAKFLNPRK
ncbi:MAG: hypothetical protein A3D92_15105 [Bacteroidetes bacterium RIFCSPHIGHO2_02_FULL_44_7]|nr:MAG: hypothetical protein A3D92_15105 [Bacteroidetes bacterium RIFCSPHIGHO2_02_FULL_44_7]